MVLVLVGDGVMKEGASATRAGRFAEQRARRRAHRQRTLFRRIDRHPQPRSSSPHLCRRISRLPTLHTSRRRRGAASCVCCCCCCCDDEGDKLDRSQLDHQPQQKPTPNFVFSMDTDDNFVSNKREYIQQYRDLTETGWARLKVYCRRGCRWVRSVEAQRCACDSSTVKVTQKMP